LQIVVPFFFIVFLYALQRGAKAADASSVANPVAYSLGGVGPCTVRSRTWVGVGRG
jgi:hypothetical protein